MQRLFWLSALTPCLIVTTLGCAGEDSDRLEVDPVTGQVQVGGQPAEGVSVIFYAEFPAPEGKKMPVPSGFTDAEGNFELTSYDQGDGAPAGEYTVAFVWNEQRPPNVTGVFEPNDRLGGRYASPEKSDVTATVPEGGGELPPFTLQ